MKKPTPPELDDLSFYGIKVSSDRERVLEIIHGENTKGQPATRRQVEEGTGFKYDKVNQLLYALKRDGFILRAASNRYVVTAAGRKLISAK